MANWYKLLRQIDATHKIKMIAIGCNLYDSLDPIANEINYEFDAGFGEIEGFSFTAWTAERVYFPCTYDGKEWIASVPRNPSNEPTEHIGKSMENHT